MIRAERKGWGGGDFHAFKVEMLIFFCEKQKGKGKKRVYTRNDILVRRFFLEIMAIIKVCYKRDTGNECLKNSDQRNQIASEFFLKFFKNSKTIDPFEMKLRSDLQTFSFFRRPAIPC